MRVKIKLPPLEQEAARAGVDTRNMRIYVNGERILSVGVSTLEFTHPKLVAKPGDTVRVDQQYEITGKNLYSNWLLGEDVIMPLNVPEPTTQATVEWVD